MAGRTQQAWDALLTGDRQEGCASPADGAAMASARCPLLQTQAEQMDGRWGGCALKPPARPWKLEQALGLVICRWLSAPMQPA